MPTNGSNSAQQVILGRAPGLSSSPAHETIAIAPNDSADLSEPVSAIYVGSPGNIVLVDLAGNERTLTAVAVGILPIGAKRVKLTNTTAGGMIGLINGEPN